MNLRFFRPRSSVPAIALFCGFYIAIAENRLFWASLAKVIDFSQFHYQLLGLATVIILGSFFSLCLLLVSHKRLFKPFIITLLMLASIIGYFQTEFGVIINKAMIQNVAETDYREAFELLSLSMLFYIGLFGVLPSLAVAWLIVEYKPIKQEMLWRPTYGLGLSMIIVLLVWGFYKDFSLILREHRELRYLINPTYALNSGYKYLFASKSKDKPPEAIAQDATRNKTAGKKTVAVLVIGETARAHNFSLNGYPRKTNPYLEKDQVISFSQTYSCGTATAESLPCIFSHLGKIDFSVEKAAEYTNVLHVLSGVGIAVLWQDNNSGCKGVCRGIETKILSNKKNPDLCTDKECYDEILLTNLQKFIDEKQSDILIVLHQKGSHGPAYYQRHPSAFSVFKPECINSSPQDCMQQDIINAYDNTILYTDYFLHKTIDFLKTSDKQFDSIMLYASDHGESLGEEGIYLHGLPYVIAPDYQIHIPFIAWLSDGYIKNKGIDFSCLERNREKTYSHDNIFHSLLGIFEVKTKFYKNGRDIFAACKSNNDKVGS